MINKTMELRLKTTINFMKENKIKRVKFTDDLVLSYDFEREEHSIWKGYMIRKGVVHRDLDTFILKTCKWLEI